MVMYVWLCMNGYVCMAMYVWLCMYGYVYTFYNVFCIISVEILQRCMLTSNLDE